MVGVLVLAAALAPDRDRPRSGSPSTAQRTATPAPTASASSSPDTGPDVLLPNLRSLDARDLQIERTKSGRRLRFAASLANLGPGPLVLIPRGRGDCRPGRLSAIQVLAVDRDGNGRYRRGVDRLTTRQFAGCMLRHPGHDHWHFDAMAAYSLRRPDAGRDLAARRKVSFCLRDNTRVRGVDTTVRREHFGECTARGRQGISPGWVDVYSADLDGQWLALPRGVDDEVVCLDLAADPRGLVEETDETDNATSVAVRVSGGSVRRAGSGACA